MIISVPQRDAGEVGSVAREIEVPVDRHEYVRRIIERLGETREVGVRQVVDVVAKAHGWSVYVQNVAAWLRTRGGALDLIEPEQPGAAVPQIEIGLAEGVPPLN